MAIQIRVDEVQGCKGYLEWLVEKSQIQRETGKILFENDFRSDMTEDDIRARDGLELRMVYAKDVGSESGKNERDIDRIWKSIHGKCSVLEVLVKLAFQLDGMVNEEEKGSMVPYFMEEFLKNLEILKLKFGENPKKNEAISEEIQRKIDRFLDRNYNKNGTGGGLFPVKNCANDHRKLAIWKQMNEWLDEHLDEDCCFLMEK